MPTPMLQNSTSFTSVTSVKSAPGRLQDKRGTHLVGDDVPRTLQEEIIHPAEESSYQTAASSPHTATADFGYFNCIPYKADTSSSGSTPPTRGEQKHTPLFQTTPPAFSASNCGNFNNTHLDRSDSPGEVSFRCSRSNSFASADDTSRTASTHSLQDILPKIYKRIPDVEKATQMGRQRLKDHSTVATWFGIVAGIICGAAATIGATPLGGFFAFSTVATLAPLAVFGVTVGLAARKILRDHREQEMAASGVTQFIEDMRELQNGKLSPDAHAATLKDDPDYAKALNLYNYLTADTTFKLFKYEAKHMPKNIKQAILAMPQTFKNTITGQFDALRLKSQNHPTNNINAEPGAGA